VDSSPEFAKWESWAGRADRRVGAVTYSNAFRAKYQFPAADLLMQVFQIQLSTVAFADYNRGKSRSFSLQCANCQWRSPP
jgi:hypothetical protein